MKFAPYLKQYLKQSLQVFKHPLQLLPSILLTAIWIVLGIVQIRVQDNLPVKVLNFLTYAQGGLYGGVVGAIGGVLGKVLVAAAVNALLVPLFRGKKPLSGLGGGIKELFGSISFQGRAAVAPLLKGLGAALMIYCLFNLTESFQNSLVGIVAAVSFANAAGRKGGFLWGAAFSYASSISGGRTPSYKNVLRALSGMTLGFALGVGLSAAGLRYAGSTGLILLIIGWILGAGTRKEAAATAMLILLFLIPQPGLRAQDDDNPFLALMPKTLGPDREALQQEEFKGAWVLKDVETDVKSSGGGKAMFWTGSISNLQLSRMTEISFDYVWTETSTGEGTSGHGSRSITKVKSSFAPGERLDFILKGGENDNSDVIPYGHHFSLWDNIIGEENTLTCQAVITMFFPSPDDVPEGKYEFTFTFHLLSAYISNHYTFEWDKNGSSSASLPGVPDLPDWILGDDGEHASEEWTVAIGVIGGLGGALGGGLGGGLGGAGGGLPRLPEEEDFDWEAYERGEEKEEDEEEAPEDGPGNDPREPEAPRMPWQPEAPEDYEQTQQVPQQPEEEVDDYDYEAERAAREREQAEINRRYAAEHQRDWERFSNTSDQERITREAEEAIREQEQLEMYRQIEEDEEHRQENVLHYADKYGIPTEDENGNPRDIWDIEHDAKRASMWEKNKGIYQDSNDIQQICGEVEQECSEKIAECELVDKVADGTVNVLAEVVPGGDKVKDARDLLKAPLVGASEAYAEGRSVTRGLAGGLFEGTATVVQNHLDKVVDGPAKDIVDVYFEGGKKLLNDEISGKYEEDRQQSWENVQEAMVKKTGEIGLGKLLGAAGGSEESQNIAKEFLMKGHDELKFGEGDDAKTLSETVTDTINDAKNNALGEVMYQTGLY